MNFPPPAGLVSGRATPSLRHAPRAKLQRTNPGSSPLSLRGILFRRSGPALSSAARASPEHVLELTFQMDPSVGADHAIDGKCVILPFLNGKPQWGIYKPGVWGDHNIIDARGNAGEFVNYDPARLVFDLRLKTRARAIGAGSPDGAP